MKKKYIRNRPPSGSWNIEEPGWYGELKYILDKFEVGSRFLIRTGGVGRQVGLHTTEKSEDQKDIAANCIFFSYPEFLHEFGKMIYDAVSGEEYTLEIIEMEESEFEELCEKHEFGGY